LIGGRAYIILLHFNLLSGNCVGCDESGSEDDLSYVLIN